jgi:hypothetical protein
VLWRIGAVPSTRINTSTVPGRREDMRKPVTAPIRMPFILTSLRICNPSSDWRAK